jgi:hypothetical protein
LKRWRRCIPTVNPKNEEPKRSIFSLILFVFCIS